MWPARPDALQAAGDRLRRLDLDDQVDGAHVDSELERGGRDQAGQLARLEQLLDQGALLVGEGAVVGAGDLGRSLVSIPGVAGVLRRRELLLELVVVHLVEALGDALGGAAVVDEDDRRAVLADQPQQLGVDRRPDRAGVGGGVERGLDRAGVDALGGVLRGCASWCWVLPVSAPSRRLLESGLGSTMSSTGTTISRSSCFGSEASTISHSRPAPTRKSPMRSSGRWVADSPIRWPTRLRVSSSATEVRPAARALMVSARCEPRFEGATAWISSTITASTPPRISRAPRADHQIERLGRRDQDVRRLPAHPAPLGLRRVAGAQRDRDRRPDPLQRRPQVALDVVGERLERRDVDDPHARAEPLGLASEAVDPPQERGEGLARAGRRADQGVRARGDRRPAGRLGGRGGLERGLEPPPNRLGEGLQG